MLIGQRNIINHKGTAENRPAVMKWLNISLIINWILRLILKSFTVNFLSSSTEMCIKVGLILSPIEKQTEPVAKCHLHS